MITKFEILQKLETAKIVAVIRGKDADEAIAISQAAIAGGFHAIEITYTTPNTGRVFEALAAEDAVIGAGTVLDAETARHAILHGAKFIVSPHFNEKISELCNRYSIPYLPGCLTISEIVRALESGCDVVKLFPANNLSPSFIKGVNGPLPNVRMMPTGGINLDNLSDWLAAGAFAAGVGSDLTKSYRDGGKDAVTELCQKYLQIIHNK